MKATIHQPDFMPWLGFFNKIAKADCWIVLDHVENNPRDAAFWGRRVRMLVGGQPFWLSLPLNKPGRPHVIGMPIKDMTINTALTGSLCKGLKTVRMAYAKAPHFERYIHLAEAYFIDSDDNLMRRNMRFIEEVMRILRIETEIVYSSSMDARSASTQLLVDLLKEKGASTYICGGGAGGYQEDDLFASNAIALQYNEFKHPIYAQMHAPEFVPGLSILDALFSVGEEAVSEWVKG